MSGKRQLEQWKELEKRQEEVACLTLKEREREKRKLERKKQKRAKEMAGLPPQKPFWERPSPEREAVFKEKDEQLQKAIKKWWEHKEKRDKKDRERRQQEQQPHGAAASSSEQQGEQEPQGTTARGSDSESSDVSWPSTLPCVPVSPTCFAYVEESQAPSP